MKRKRRWQRVRDYLKKRRSMPPGDASLYIMLAQTMLGLDRLVRQSHRFKTGKVLVGPGPGALRLCKMDPELAKVARIGCEKPRGWKPWPELKL